MTTHHFRFRESLGAVFEGAGADTAAGFSVDAVGLGIRPNLNSVGGAAADTDAYADLRGAGTAAAAAVAAAATIADGWAVAAGIVPLAPLLKLSAAANRIYT